MSEQKAVMGERIFNEKLTVADCLKMFGGKPNNFLIAYDLMKLARKARASYLNHLEAQC